MSLPMRSRCSSLVNSPQLGMFSISIAIHHAVARQSLTINLAPADTTEDTAERHGTATDDGFWPASWFSLRSCSSSSSCKSSHSRYGQNHTLPWSQWLTPHPAAAVTVVAAVQWPQTTRTPPPWTPSKHTSTTTQPATETKTTTKASATPLSTRHPLELLRNSMAEAMMATTVNRTGSRSHRTRISRGSSEHAR